MAHLERFLKTFISAKNTFKFLLIICSIISCTTNNITNYEYDKLGFTISTGNWDNDSTLTVEISTDRGVNPLPSITINGKYPDAIDNYVEYYGFKFSKIKSDTLFSYQIVYRTDTLHDNVFIPGKIDSLFINGLYISPTMQTDVLKLPEKTDSLHLYWKDNKRTNYYRLDFSSQIGYYKSPIFTSDTSLSLYIDWNRKDFNGSTSIIFNKMNLINLYEQPVANLFSKTMVIYYFVKGPSYYAWRYIERQE